jgi:hypothetical protein
MPTIQPITPAQTYPLRHQVLWPDKPLDYVKIAEDEEGQHFGAFQDQELVSVISLFVNGLANAHYCGRYCPRRAFALVRCPAKCASLLRAFWHAARRRRFLQRTDSIRAAAAGFALNYLQIKN